MHPPAGACRNNKLPVCMDGCVWLAPRAVVQVMMTGAPNARPRGLDNLFLTLVGVLHFSKPSQSLALWDWTDPSDGPSGARTSPQALARVHTRRHATHPLSPLFCTALPLDNGPELFGHPTPGQGMRTSHLLPPQTSPTPDLDTP